MGKQDLRNNSLIMKEAVRSILMAQGSNNRKRLTSHLFILHTWKEHIIFQGLKKKKKKKKGEGVVGCKNNALVLKFQYSFT